MSDVAKSHSLVWTSAPPPPLRIIKREAPIFLMVCAVSQGMIQLLVLLIHRCTCFQRQSDLCGRGLRGAAFGSGALRRHKGLEEGHRNHKGLKSPLTAHSYRRVGEEGGKFMGAQDSLFVKGLVQKTEEVVGRSLEHRRRQHCAVQISSSTTNHIHLFFILLNSEP